MFVDNIILRRAVGERDLLRGCGWVVGHQKGPSILLKFNQSVEQDVQISNMALNVVCVL